MKAYKMMFYKLAAKYNLPQEITKQIFTEGLAPVIIQAAFRGHLDRSRQPAFSWQHQGGHRYYENAVHNAEPGIAIWHYWFREALPQSLLAGFAWNMNELMNVCGWYWRMPDEVEKRLKKLGLKGEALKDALIKERGSQEWKPIPFYHPEGSMVNVANKLYSLRTQLKSVEGVVIELCKAKGMSKGIFNFNSYRDAFGDWKVSLALRVCPGAGVQIALKPHRSMVDPGQKQFKLGLSAYCQENMPAIYVKSLVKRASACYSKGNWDRKTNKVTPFYTDGAIESNLPLVR